MFNLQTDLETTCYYCSRPCERLKCAVKKCQTYSHRNCLSVPKNGAFTFDEDLWFCPCCHEDKRKKTFEYPPCPTCHSDGDEPTALVVFCYLCDKQICWDCRAGVRNVQDDMVCDDCMWNVTCSICNDTSLFIRYVFCSGPCKRQCHIKCLGYTEADDYLNWQCLVPCTIGAKDRPKESIVESVNNNYVDQKEHLTRNSVPKLASGMWDGEPPFVVQIVPIPNSPSCDENLLFELTGCIGITDGDSVMTVALSPRTAHLMKCVGGWKQTFSLIHVSKCDCIYLPKTKVHLRIPGIIKRFSFHFHEQSPQNMVRLLLNLFYPRSYHIQRLDQRLGLLVERLI